MMILTLLFFLSGLGVVGWAGRRIWFRRRSLQWPQATGIVTRSQVIEEQDNDSSIWFVPKIEYSFEVHGIPFTGNALTFGFFNEQFATRPEAEQRAAQFPISSQVIITYRPDDPKDCVLEPKLAPGVYGLFFFGLSFVVFAVWAFTETILLKRP